MKGLPGEKYHWSGDLDFFMFLLLLICLNRDFTRNSEIF